MENENQDFIEAETSPSLRSNDINRTRNYKYRPQIKNQNTGIDIKEKLGNAAGNSMKVAGKSAELAGKGAQVLGKGAQAAGTGLSNAGAALSSTGLGAIAGVPLQALGGATKALGKGTELAGKSTEKLGKKTNEAGDKTKEAVKNSSNKKNNKLSNKNGIDNDSNKLKKARKPILNKYKNNDNEEEKDDDKKKKKTTSKTLDNNALNVVKNTIGSTITRVANTLKAFASGDINEAMKNLGLLFFKLFGPLLISVIFLAIIIYMIFSPLLEVLKKIDEAATNVANFSEKLDNLYHGFGFQNTKDAFFDEIQDLNKKYYNQLDLELLMSTIFYSEIYEGYESTSFNDSESEGVVDESFSGKDSKSMFSIFKSLVKGKVIEKLKESKETTDENGLTYTLGKIYRLRKLARNQFANGYFGGAAREGELRTENLGYFLNTLGEDVKDVFAALIVVLYNYTIGGITRNINNVITSAVLDYLIGKGYNYTEEELNNMGNMISNLGLSLEDLVGDFFVSIGSIEKVDFDIDVFEDVALPIVNKIKNDLKCVVLWDCADAESAIKLVKDVLENVLTGVNITFHTYQFSEEAYTNYLKKYYIPNMPEFRKYVYDKNGKVVEKEVNRIVREIYETKDMYIDIFGKTYVEQTENYDDACAGAVNRDVVALLTLPVNIDSSTCVDFTKDYGFGVTSSGEDHKGIDFNEVTTKTKVNDPVYSIADGGKVLESSTDNTWSGTCKGGCLKIEYSVTSNLDNYKFTIIYEGMDHNSVTLTKDSTVNKGTQIGIIGSAAESEDGKMSSLHFAYLDNSTNSYIDPTNIIIPCSDHIEGNSNSALIYNAIMDSSLDDRYKDNFHIAAILGNAAKESGINFKCLQGNSCQGNNGNDFENPFRSGKQNAAGFLQWDFERRNRLFDYANSKGIKWYNPDIQLNYMIGEMTNGGGADGFAQFNWNNYRHQNLNSCVESFLNEKTDLGFATTLFCDCFERAGTPDYNFRNAQATEWLSRLNSGNIDNDSSTTTSSVGLKSCSTSSNGSVASSSAITPHSVATNEIYNQRKNQIMPEGVKKTKQVQELAYMQTITVPIWDGTQETTMNLRVNKYLVDNYQAVFKELTELKFPILSSETAAYVYRTVRSSGRLSDHGFGSAIDVNWTHNPQYGYPDNTQYGITEDVIKAFAKQGFYWGGDWSTDSLDPMHFSWCGY